MNPLEGMRNLPIGDFSTSKSSQVKAALELTFGGFRDQMQTAMKASRGVGSHNATSKVHFGGPDAENRSTWVAKGNEGAYGANLEGTARVRYEAYKGGATAIGVIAKAMHLKPGEKDSTAKSAAKLFGSAVLVALASPVVAVLGLVEGVARPLEALASKAASSEKIVQLEGFQDFELGEAIDLAALNGIDVDQDRGQAVMKEVDQASPQQLEEWAETQPSPTDHEACFRYMLANKRVEIIGFDEFEQGEDVVSEAISGEADKSKSYSSVYLETDSDFQLKNAIEMFALQGIQVSQERGQVLLEDVDKASLEKVNEWAANQPDPSDHEAVFRHTLANARLELIEAEESEGQSEIDETDTETDLDDDIEFI